MALASPSLSELFEEDSKYLFRDARLKSYTKNWPHKEPNLSPEKVPFVIQMADAGFFFNPGNSDDDDDNVQCPFCFKQLTGWEPDDDPLLEHQKRQDRCYFVRMGKKEEDWTVQDFMLLLAQRRCASLVSSIALFPFWLIFQHSLPTSLVHCCSIFATIFMLHSFLYSRCLFCFSIIIYLFC
ncbi:unnamed protein product [Anisakis simplex]|uniref:Deterin (inferred by orthology to a D. melanogaster protein) n=1 Tax=Anisakis simplex TaxID=6269 RepID=A0A0M3K0T8_ANISI|nr:unnamed protein product [Anisakis simplex]